MGRSLPLVAALAVAVIASPGAAREKTDPLAGRVAGTPQACVSGVANDGLVIAGPDTVMTRQFGRRIWVAKAIGCPALRPDDILIVEHLSGSGYCSNDRFRAMTRGATIPGPFCRLGKFTPYDKAR